MILVINKIDRSKREELLEVIAAYQKVCRYAEIVPVSALTGENKEELLKTIFNYLPEGPQFYEESVITDQPERQIVAELIREYALKLLDEEIPHGIAVAIESMKEEKDTSKRHSHKMKMVIEATIVCEKESHKGMIIGKQGTMLKKIGTGAREEIEALLDMKVYLNLWVKVKKNWRDSDFYMKNFGYDRQEES